jgi:hypothetical protein
VTIIAIINCHLREKKQQESINSLKMQIRTQKAILGGPVPSIAASFLLYSKKKRD